MLRPWPCPRAEGNLRASNLAEEYRRRPRCGRYGSRRRTALYLLATAPGEDGDVGIYQRWYACCFSHGRFPLADPMWQYPPGAALVFWLPGHLPGGYVNSFVFLAIGCDLATTLMLAARGRRGGSPAGAWYWVCGVPVLGAVTVTRFDTVAVALSVAACA